MNVFKKIASNRHIQSLLQVRSVHQHIPKTPDLIYVPQFMRWMNTKMRFMYLKLAWDPEFSEGSFIYGSTRAICLITDIIHRDKPEELEGLLSPLARARLITRMNMLTPLQRKIIKLHPVDIKIVVPIAVRFLAHEKDRKSCAVVMRSLALKWLDDGRSLKLVLVALQTEFSRNYSEGVAPDWILTLFEILECAQLSDSHAISRK